jgi:hypothetical protein
LRLWVRRSVPRPGIRPLQPLRRRSRTQRRGTRPVDRAGDRRSPRRGCEGGEPGRRRRRRLADASSVRSSFTKLLGSSYPRFILVSSDTATVRGMQKPTKSRPRAAVARDAAQLRLRRATQISVAVMVALGSAFAALAAGSTTTKKTLVRTPARRVHTALLTQAPAPPLVAARSASSSDESAAAPATAPAAPAPPAAAPAPSYSPPVVVSGGS